jgi:hypothetical protein
MSKGAYTACSVFLESGSNYLDPCFILNYDTANKIRFILLARQNISCQVKSGSFLVVSQLSGVPPSANL